MHLVPLKHGLLLTRLRVVVRTTCMHLYTVWSWGDHAPLGIVVALLVLELPLLLFLPLVLQVLNLGI